MTTYSYTGATQDHVVGADVYFVKLVVTGAKGGDYGAQVGGNGHRVEAIYPVTPGETLKITVGGEGADGSSSSPTTQAGGWPDGGTAFAGSGLRGGAGGGSSDVRQGGTGLSDRIIVGGAGGGAGFSSGYNGGPGVWPSGNNISGSAVPGSQTAAGAGGGVVGEGVGEAGSFGEGGDSYTSGGSGSGGGGWYGGGGGGRNTGFGAWIAGGAGGSSYINEDLTLSLGPGLYWDPPYGRVNHGAVGTGDGSVEVTEYTGYYETTGLDTPMASGGTEYDSLDGRWHFHRFEATDTLTITQEGYAEILAVGGGGQGGKTVEGGGGGGGGVLRMPIFLEGASMTVTVGTGGDVSNGGDSSIGLAVAKGGGKGGAAGAGGNAGGSGGGGGAGSTAGGAGSTQGYPGGNGRGGISAYSEGGGGGGASAAGQNSPANYIAGNGADGIAISDFDDTTTYYVSGGGAAEAGTAGLYSAGYSGGYGGGSTGGAAAALGDDGVVIIKYANPYSRIEATLDGVGTMVAGVIQREPVSIVQADLDSAGMMTVQMRNRQFQQARLKRTLVWVNGLDGVRRNVLD